MKTKQLKEAIKNKETKEFAKGSIYEFSAIKAGNILILKQDGDEIVIHLEDISNLKNFIE